MSKITSKDNFSVALGLTDYVNPILYLITSVTIILNLNKLMSFPSNMFYIFGVIISLIFGFAIPTVKLLVGLGKIEFMLPVNFVFYVNSGIFLSGLMLIKSTLEMNIYLLLFLFVLSFLILLTIYLKSKKFNNIAVIIGAIGYLLIYISLISKAVSCLSYTPIIFYGIAILLYVMLIGIGIKADLKDARVHWMIELSNIICQSSVAIGTVILFLNY